MLEWRTTRTTGLADDPASPNSDFVAEGEAPEVR